MDYFSYLTEFCMCGVVDARDRAGEWCQRPMWVLGSCQKPKLAVPMPRGENQ